MSPQRREEHHLSTYIGASALQSSLYEVWGTDNTNILVFCVHRSQVINAPTIIPDQMTTLKSLKNFDVQTFLSADMIFQVENSTRGLIDGL